MLLSVLLIPNAFAQCENKSGFARLACQAQANSSSAALPPGVSDPKAAISTGLADAIHLGTQPPTDEPMVFEPLTELDRTDDGSFILKTGFYEAYVQSYTLDAGDVNATKPGGYYPAPIKGKKAKIIAALLKQVELHPDVPQADIQQLLFAIVQGTDLEKMTPAVQQTAARVLPQDTLKQMQGAEQAKVFQQNLMAMLNQRLAQNPAAQQQMNQWNNLQKQLESAAPPPTFKSEADADLPIARGTWAQMPGGFYVRYLPEGYMKTRLQVIVPKKAIEQAQTPLTFDPTQYLAILVQAPSERIGISLRPAH
ncbi:MAG TPA: hypothetical protein VMI06_10590 [Terriglobia bacterium]|nr:hypothetical protein [Terriglobia bacterium]